MMNKRFSRPVRNELNELNDMQARTTKCSSNLYMKRYPNFFKREDVHGDFISMQRELKTYMPTVRIIKEDIDANFARIQFDVASIDEILLEKILAKRGFVKNSKSL